MSPEEVYKLIESYKEDDPRLKKYCWQNEPACICYFAQMHEEFICETYHWKIWDKSAEESFQTLF